MNTPDVKNSVDNDDIKMTPGKSAAHDSAYKHVSGSADYVDDIRVPEECTHIYIAYSERAHAKILSVNLDAVRNAPGVIGVLTAKDIPGENDVGAVFHDELLFAVGAKNERVECYGQSLFAVVATSFEAARRAGRLAKIEYEDLPAILTIDDALSAQSFLEPPQHMSRGDAKTELSKVSHRLNGDIEIGGQEHFYLEGQAALAIPGEDGDVEIYCSSQHPSEIQHKVADALGVMHNSVTVQVRRMGGGFGGKETNGNLPAVVAAIAANRYGRAAKVRYDRDDDIIMTGKRHDFKIWYDVAFHDDGRIHAISIKQAALCGWTADLSLSICDRAMFHADNCYYLPHVDIESFRCKTNTVSNTAFRGFGGPQGMMAMERVIEDIACHLKIDPLEVRRINFYDPENVNTGRNITPYHMKVDDCVIEEIVGTLTKSSDYYNRKREIADWNEKQQILYRGISLTPLKFGISFTATHLNQAGALVHIYKDGSIHLNHGGTEMGQGLYIKIAQLVADEFHVGIEKVKITAAHTGKVPNTSPTAASSGTDINGMAALDACKKIKKRLIEFAAEKAGLDEDKVRFAQGCIEIGDQKIEFENFILRAYMARVSLSANGFYKTPKISWDRSAGRGRPFYYFAYGAACSEVVIDRLTGEYRLLRTDILHDCGKSLNPAIDLGQIEGGFIQGVGWLTTEELWWDGEGRLKTHAPSTYKIPTASDRPLDMRINMWREGINREETVLRSKAVGEPPLMLGMSVFFALSNATKNACIKDKKNCKPLHAPATPERILMAMNSDGS